MSLVSQPSQHLAHCAVSAISRWQTWTRGTQVGRAARHDRCHRTPALCCPSCADLAVPAKLVHREHACSEELTSSAAGPAHRVRGNVAWSQSCGRASGACLPARPLCGAVWLCQTSRVGHRRPQQSSAPVHSDSPLTGKHLVHHGTPHSDRHRWAQCYTRRRARVQSAVD